MLPQLLREIVRDGGLHVRHDAVDRLPVRQPRARVQQHLRRVIRVVAHELVDVVRETDLALDRGAAEHFLQGTADGEAASAVCGFLEPEEAILDDTCCAGLGGAEADEDVAGVEDAEGLEGRLIAAGVELSVQAQGLVASSGMVDHDLHDLLACRTGNGLHV